MDENKEWLDIPDFLRNPENLAEERASDSTALLYSRPDMKTIRRDIEVPAWATFMAQNAIGDWYAFEYPPVWRDGDGWVAPDGKEEKLFTGPIRKPERRTLQRI